MNLQGVEMQDATLSGSILQEGLFSETFDAIMGVAISSSGEYWAASSRNGEIRIWEAGGQRLHRVWQAHSDLIWSLAFSPDERTLASGGFDGILKLWNVASGALIWSGRHTEDVMGGSFAPDGRSFASSGGRTVILWDIQRGAQLQVLPHPHLVIPVAWSPDGGLIASGDMEGMIRLWAVNEADPAVCVLELAGHTKQVNALAFSPDGRTLASGGWDGAVRLWDTSTLRLPFACERRSPNGRSVQAVLSAGEASVRLRKTLAGYFDRVNRLIWSPDGRLLAGGSYEKTIWLWDDEQDSYRTALHGHTDAVIGIAFTPGGRSLISSGDSTLRVWDVPAPLNPGSASGRCVRILQGSTVSIFDVDWSPDGAQLMSGGSDALLALFDVTGEASTRVLHGHRGLVFGVAWSPDGQQLASSSWDQEIRLWDPASGECVEVLQNPDDPNTLFYNVAWSPDGQRLAGAPYLNLRGVLVWELRDAAGRSQRWLSPPHPTRIRRAAWSPDGSQLAGGGDDGSVYLWEVSGGTLLQQLAGHPGAVMCLAWSPAGTFLTSGGRGKEGGELFVWDALRRKCLRTFVGHPEIVYALAWGENEGRVVSGGDDGALRWWDVQGGECVRVRAAHQGMVQSLRRSPDGRILASGGADGPSSCGTCTAASTCKPCGATGLTSGSISPGSGA